MGTQDLQIQQHQESLPGEMARIKRGSRVGQAKSRDAAALPSPQRFQLPNPLDKIKKAPLQDKRTYCVIPSRILSDKTVRPTQIKVLAAFASYANPAGVTWVGLKRVGQDLGISGQAVHKHLTILKNRGYIEEISKAFAREKAATRRIIYDSNISADDAISINSSREDCRPPEQIRKEEAMARKKKEATVTEKILYEDRSLHNIGQPQSVEEPGKLSLDEAIRVLQSYAVNVNESLLRWLEMACELGASRSMIETCGREADPVGAVKVLVTRLDRACR